MRPSISALTILALFSFAGALAVWFGLGNELMLEASIAAVAFILFFAVASTLIQERIYFAAALLIPFLVALIELKSPSWVWLILAVAFLFIWYGYWKAISEKKVSPGTAPGRMLAAGFYTFMTGVALCGALLYYVHHATSVTTALIPRPMFDFIFPYISKFGQNAMNLPTPIDSNQSIDDLLRQLVTSQLGTSQRIPDSMLSKEIIQGIYLQREALNKQYGINLKGNEKVSDVVYDLINESGESILGPYANILGYVLAGGIFFGIKAVSFIFFYLCLGFVYLLIGIAKPLGLIKVEEETITVKHYSL